MYTDYRILIFYLYAVLTSIISDYINAMIQFDNVSYSYKKGGGVSNVNLSLDDDEYVLLIGPTGSGKTTLLRLAYM